MEILSDEKLIYGGFKLTNYPTIWFEHDVSMVKIEIQVSLMYHIIILVQANLDANY